VRHPLPPDEVDRRLGYLPVLGGKTDYRIGIVGAGGIVQGAHLPAYRMAGFHVTALWNRTLETARSVAAQFDIPKVCASWEELVASPDVDVVDIALPPHLQPDVATAAAACSKHILVQKPMATTYADAVRMVRAAREAGVKLAVNQNGRWDPAIRAARTLIGRGILGTRLTAFVELRTLQPWQRFWQDREHYRQLMLLGMSVHHVDQFRFLFGDPVSVSAITRPVPSQPWEGDAIAHYWLAYDDGFFASALDDGATWTRDTGVRFRFTGTDGVLAGTMGWPHATYSTLRYIDRNEGIWHEPAFRTKWIPEAFIGTMGALFAAIEHDRPAEMSGEDNLKTLQAVFAGYRSAAEHRAVRLREIEEEAKL
jgi:predicted dehydrogenase